MVDHCFLFITLSKLDTIAYFHSLATFSKCTIISLFSYFSNFSDVNAFAQDIIRGTGVAVKTIFPNGVLTMVIDRNNQITLQNRFSQI